jgi:hypothetical protein
MIEPIAGLPEGVIGFEGKGHVTGEDYEQVLVPAIEEALRRNEKLSLIYVLGEEFEAYTGEAMWDDTKVGMRHPFSFKRIALVTDHDAYRHMLKGFGFLTPAKVKTFSGAELEEAKSWVAGD